MKNLKCLLTLNISLKCVGNNKVVIELRILQDPLAKLPKGNSKWCKRGPIFSPYGQKSINDFLWSSSGCWRKESVHLGSLVLTVRDPRNDHGKDFSVILNINTISMTSRVSGCGKEANYKIGLSTVCLWIDVLALQIHHVNYIQLEVLIPIMGPVDMMSNCSAFTYKQEL